MSFSCPQHGWRHALSPCSICKDNGKLTTTNDLSFQGFNVVDARRITELESQNGELIKDLKDLVEWVKNSVEMGFPHTEDLEKILNRIEMKRGVLFV